jgi:phosphoribosylamine--glycine ligase
MRILVVGSGGREHALCWALSRDPGVEVLAAPGNPGIAALARLHPVAAGDADGLLELAAREGVDLTVVGPEAPLAAGLADRFAAAGRLLLGPTRSAARLETSKAFAKAFMARHGVPTAGWRVCDTPEEARRAIDEFGVPVVVKADGLAAGKGVVVARSRAEAEAAADAALIERRFGEAGARLVIEECLAGREASYFVLADGERSVFLGTAEDHKRAFDDDRGPNTGGMGAFAPSPLVTPALRARIEREIVEPTLAGLREEGTPFRGFLYVGLMLTAEGPRVVEFNVRLGDPEAQVVLPGLDEPLAPRLAEAAAGRLSALPLRHGPSCHVGIVLASEGYPGPFERGRPIGGLDVVADRPDVLVFHAGTALRDGTLVTDGGRVLTVVGRGPDFASAASRAYEAAACIRFDGMHYRRDIGRKALAR